MGVPVIASVSEKRAWVEKTIASLAQSFDKKQLLESADSLGDAEIRSLIATSITGSMAKRKLEQYLERASNDEDGSLNAESQGAQDRELPGETPVQESAEQSTDFTAPIDAPQERSKDAAPTARLPTRFEAIRESEVDGPVDAQSRTEKNTSSSERFDRLEKTVLASKSKPDLTVPQIPDDIVATIRELKTLAQRKVEAPSYTEPKRQSLRSDDLLEAFESEVERSTPTGSGGEPAAGASSELSGVLPAQESREARVDAKDTLDEFEAFLSEPSNSVSGPQPAAPSEDRSTIFTASQVSEPTLPDEQPQPLPAPKVPPAPPHTPRAPPPKPPVRLAEPSGVPSDREVPQDAKASAQTGASARAASERREDITAHFDRLLATMGELNADLPAQALAPQQASVEEPEHPVSEAPAAPISFPTPEHHEPYDGTWIEGCETISDVLDVIGEAVGPIEDVRTTVALFVLGFSDELAVTIRTAQSRDELELMLRKALTATIDDAFERTSTRFIHERESFAREAGLAADALQESIEAAESEERARVESERRAALERERRLREAEALERARFEAEERARVQALERARFEAEERARVESERRLREDAQAREKLRLQATREEIERAERERLSVEHVAQEHESSLRAADEHDDRSDEVLSGPQILASTRAVHERAESESAEDVTAPIAQPERAPTVPVRISALIGTLHELIEQGSYDEALRTLSEVRELLARQIELKEHRSESVVDERMADFELKALALDLEILKARE